MSIMSVLTFTGFTLLPHIIIDNELEIKSKFFKRVLNLNDLYQLPSC